MNHKGFELSCPMEGDVVVECVIVNNCEAEEEWEDDASICDVADAAETFGQDRQDLTLGLILKGFLILLLQK